MKVSFVKSTATNNGTLVVGVFEDIEPGQSFRQIDTQNKGAISRAIKAHNRFFKKRGEFVSVAGLNGVTYDRVIVAGLGKSNELSVSAAREIGGLLLPHLLVMNQQDVTFLLDVATVKQVTSKNKKKADLSTDMLDINQFAANLAYGLRLKEYRFDKYKTTLKPKDKAFLGSLTFLVNNPAATQKIYDELAHTIEGVFLTRDLVSEPANVIYPKSLADRARALTKLGVKVEVLGVAEMKKLGMGSLLGVGQGSANESQLLVMEWPGDDKKAEPVAFVGKGVTFDTGGISLKPAANMEEMKTDMAGAATVIGLMHVLASRKSKARVIGLAGLVENMPSGTAQRPSDVVTSMSGQTIEIINTDAEGRLVLADVLWYCQQRFKPKYMVDLATLTGAIVVALGHHYAGLFSNDQRLADLLISSSKKVDEPIWQMPLHENYNKIMNSDIADVKNAAGRDAGSITAAQFLQRFVKDTAWAHLDIAGVAWTEKDIALCPKGATGFGVRLLNQFVVDNFEK